MGVIEHQEDPEVAAIRQALGAIAAAPPEAYWLYADDAEREWCVRREGHPDVEHFANRDEALAFVRLAVVRCTSYRLYLQGRDGHIARRSCVASLAAPYVENPSTPASWLHYAALIFALLNPHRFPMPCNSHPRLSMPRQ
jgi:hypothetical protein